MSIDFTQALDKLPVELSSSLAAYLSDNAFSGQLTAQHVKQLAQDSGMSPSEIPLYLLPVAAAYACPPISDFRVGAIAKGISGNLYFGANIEFSGTQMGQTIHAEQASIVHAWMAGETTLTEIIIDTAPCGHCRQFMNELSGAENLYITLPGKPSQLLHHYLPESFGPKDLGIMSGLMAEENHRKHVDTTNELVQYSIQALNKSYAPYSKNYSGIAIETTNHQIYTGAYAENAAFNPSLPPLQVALIQARMGGKELKDIKRVVLAEMENTRVSHLGDTRIMLEQINSRPELSYIQVS